MSTSRREPGRLFGSSACPLAAAWLRGRYLQPGMSSPTQRACVLSASTRRGSLKTSSQTRASAVAIPQVLLSAQVAAR